MSRMRFLAFEQPQPSHYRNVRIIYLSLIRLCWIVIKTQEM